MAAISLVVRIGVDASGFRKGMNEFKRDLNRATASWQMIGQGFIDVGQSLTKAVTLPIVGLAVASTRTAMDFEKAMSKVQTATGVSGEELEKLSDLARYWGRNSVYNANEVAAAMEMMGLAGMSAAQMTEALPHVLRLAQSAQMDVAQVVPIVTSAMNNFNLEAEEAVRVTDLLATANKNAPTSVNDLGKALTNASAIAALAGQSIEDTVAVLGLFSIAGINGAQAGTAYNQMMRDLRQASQDGAEGLRSLGVAIYDNYGAVRPMPDILRDFEQALDGLSPEQVAYKLDFMTDAGGRSLSQVLNNMDALDGLSYALDNAAGATEHYANIMGDNLHAELRIMKNNLRDVGIEIGNVFLPVIRDLVQGITDTVRAFAENLTPEMARTIVQFAGIAAAVGPLLIVIGNIIIFTSRLSAAFQLLRGKHLAPLIKAFKALAAPLLKKIAIFVIIGKVIGFFIDTIKEAYETCEDFRATVHRVFDQVREIISRVMEAVGEIVKTITARMAQFWDDHGDRIMKLVGKAFEFISDVIINVVTFILEFVSAALERLQDFWYRNGEQIMETVSTIFNTIWQVVSTVMELVGPFVMDVIQNIKEFWDEHGEQFMEAVINAFFIIKDVVFGAMEAVHNAVVPVVMAIWELFQIAWPYIQMIAEKVWDKISSAISGAISVIQGIIRVFTAIFTGDWDAFWDGIKLILYGIWTAITGYLTAVWGFIATLASGVWESVRDFFAGIWQSIKSTASNMWISVRDFFVNLWNSIRNTITSVWNGIRDFFMNTFNAIRDTIQNVWNGIKTFYVNIWNSIRNTIISVWNGIRDFFVNIFNAIRDTISNAMNGIRDTIRNVWDNITGFLRGINLFQIGRDIIQGLINGISNMIGSVRDIVSNIGSTITGGLRDVLRINSPSKETEEIGEHTGEGPIVGMKRKFDEIKRVAKEMGRLMIPKPDYNVSVNQSDLSSEMASLTSNSGPIQIVLDKEVVGEILAPDIQLHLNRGFDRTNSIKAVMI